MITPLENKGKRGFILPLAALITIIIVVAVLAIALIVGINVSNKFKFIIFGLLLLVGFFYVLGKGINHGFDKQKTFVLIAILSVSMLFIFGSNILQATLTGAQFVQAPQFGYIKCEPTGSQIQSSVFTLTNGYSNTIGCENLGPTSGCQLVIKTPSYSWWQNDRTLTLIDRSSNSIIFQQHLGTWLSKTTPTDKAIPNTLTPGTYLDPHRYELKFEVINFLTGKVSYSSEPLNYYYVYQPFVLKRYDSFSSTNGQAITSIGPTSCQVSSDIGNDLISFSTIAALAGGSKEGSPSRLEPNEAYTYFTRHVTVPSFSTGTDVANAYCISTGTGGTLYKIEDVQTDAGSYKVVSPTYSAPIGTVDCCNGDSVPGRVCRSNKWVDVANAQCSATKLCPNDQYQRDVSDPSGKTAVRYTCVNSKCVAQTKQVTCTLNQQCGAGKICVGFECKETCENCNPDDTCGNGKCESYENKDSCPKDCSPVVIDSCQWYEKPATINEVNYRWYNYIGIGEPDVVTTKGCKNNSLLLLIIIGGFATIIIISYLFISQNKSKKKIKKGKK